MSVPGNSTYRICSCGCNRSVSRTTEWRHVHKGTEPPPSPKRRRINGSNSRADANSLSSGHPQFPAPQLHAPSFEFNSPSPLLSPPPASHTEASVLIVDDVLRNLHVRTHRTTDQSDDEDPEDALEGDTVEGADSVDHEMDGPWNGEDVAMDDDVDPHEGIVSDWDLLAAEFIVEAEELGESEPSLLHAL